MAPDTDQRPKSNRPVGASSSHHLAHRPAGALGLAGAKGAPHATYLHNAPSAGRKRNYRLALLLRGFSGLLRLGLVGGFFGVCRVYVGFKQLAPVAAVGVQVLLVLGFIDFKNR